MKIRKETLNYDKKKKKWWVVSFQCSVAVFNSNKYIK
jgi:hypothetical protein